MMQRSVRWGIPRTFLATIVYGGMVVSIGNDVSTKLDDGVRGG